MFLLYNENHAIVAWFKKGFADEQKTNKKPAKNVLVWEAPLCKGSSAGGGEGLSLLSTIFLQPLRHGVAVPPPRAQREALI